MTNQIQSEENLQGPQQQTTTIFLPTSSADRFIKYIKEERTSAKQPYSFFPPYSQSFSYRMSEYPNCNPKGH